MSRQRVGVVGVGMTRFVRRALESGRELAFEAAQMALIAAGITLKDVDAVVLGSGPDAFDGFHRKGDAFADSVGGWHKPFVRSQHGGATGVMALIQGWMHVASGQFDTCLVVGVDKMSSCHPSPQLGLLTAFDPILERPLLPSLLSVAAMEQQRYMAEYGLAMEDVAQVAVKNKRNAADHPCAQLGGEVSMEEVVGSEILAWPLNRLTASPVSDGAAAMVLCGEKAAKKRTEKPVWVDGVGWSVDSTSWTNRDLLDVSNVEKAAQMAYRMAGVKSPREEIHVAEPYDPFAYKELQHLEALGLVEKGEAARVTEEGVTQRDGTMPVCPSGGLLGVGNPIGAAGLMKACELFWQLRGEAGKRQVTHREPEVGVVQAWGARTQAAAVAVLSTRKEAPARPAAAPTRSMAHRGEGSGGKGSSGRASAAKGGKPSKASAKSAAKSKARSKSKK